LTKTNKTNKGDKKKKRWLGLEPHEAFTEPIKDPDPGGKIYHSGVKIEEAKQPTFTPVVYKRELEPVKDGDVERLYWGTKERVKKKSADQQC